MYSSSSSDEEEAILLLSLLDDRNRRRRRRRQWVHPINLQRRKCGEYHTLMLQLRQDNRRFYKYFRMSPDCFDEVLGLIRDDITKADTNYREAISAEERLVITLRFLATGDSYVTIGHSFRVGFETVSQIVQEVCTAICSKMEHIYMPEPTEEIWKQSAKGFEELWQVPNCVGSIDDIGGYGKNSDGGIFEASNMGQRFEANIMNMPQDKALPGQDEPCPHVLIGDEAFALKPYLMRPYPYRQSRVNPRLEKYNTRLCRARRVVENAFGILAHKFRIYFRPIETKVETTILIVKTTCVLHNFLLSKRCDEQIQDEQQGCSSTQQGPFVNMDTNPRRATNRALQVREQFVNFFNNA